MIPLSDNISSVSRVSVSPGLSQPITLVLVKSSILLIADLMISDTSSVVYEFLLLDKPVITFKNNSLAINWDNQLSFDGLVNRVAKNLLEDPFKQQRLKILNEYHPYTDGNSAKRMVDAVEEYIKTNGVPEKRLISWFRRYKINKIFSKI